MVVWNEFRVMNSFTLETSMYGAKTKKAVVVKLDNGMETTKMKSVARQLDIADFQSIGINMLKTFS